MMLRRVLWWTLLGSAGAGCSTFDPKHPLVGKPPPQLMSPAHAGYYVWWTGGVWHVRMSRGARPHRFQGSLAGVRGGVTDLETTRPDLSSNIALVGDAVQFDVDAADQPGSFEAGFDARVAGGCARLELLLDGKSRAEAVRLGPKALPAHRLPLERCP
jgi:hypothetical protein